MGSAELRVPNGALGLSEAYCGQQIFTSQKDKWRPWWVGKHLWTESTVVRIEPLQGNSSPLTGPLITVLPLSLLLYSQASWESYSHSLSSLPHLLRTLPAGGCPHESNETVLAHVTRAHLHAKDNGLPLSFSCWTSQQYSTLSASLHCLSCSLSPSLPPTPLGAPSQSPVFTGLSSYVIASIPKAEASQQQSNGI